MRELLKIRPTSTKRGGWVYFVQDKQGYTKIGQSKDLVTRIKTLSVVLPYDLVCALAIYSSDYKVQEREFHDLFKEKRVRGEWFTLDDEDIDYLVSDSGFYGERLYIESSLMTKLKDRLPEVYP